MDTDLEAWKIPTYLDVQPRAMTFETVDEECKYRRTVSAPDDGWFVLSIRSSPGIIIEDSVLYKVSNVILVLAIYINILLRHYS